MTPNGLTVTVSGPTVDKLTEVELVLRFSAGGTAVARVGDRDAWPLRLKADACAFGKTVVFSADKPPAEVPTCKLSVSPAEHGFPRNAIKAIAQVVHIEGPGLSWTWPGLAQKKDPFAAAP